MMKAVLKSLSFISPRVFAQCSALLFSFSIFLFLFAASAQADTGLYNTLWPYNNSQVDKYIFSYSKNAICQMRSSDMRQVSPYKPYTEACAKLSESYLGLDSAGVSCKIDYLFSWPSNCGYGPAGSKIITFSVFSPVYTTCAVISTWPAGTPKPIQCSPLFSAAPKNVGPPSCGNSAGNPINIGFGNKFQREIDYSSSSLVLARNYNSLARLNPSALGQIFGWNWSNTFSRAIVANGQYKTVYRPDGRSFNFSYISAAATWQSDADVKSTLTQLSGGGWIYLNADNNELEEYSSSGQLLSITARGGYSQTLTYSDGTTGVSGGYVLDSDGGQTAATLPTGLLIRVTDSHGRVLKFGYDAFNHVVKITDPANGVYSYRYDGSSAATNGNLTSVTYPDGKIRSYLYNEPLNTSGANLPNALTGIIDENGNQFAAWKYDSQGRAISSEHDVVLGSTTTPVETVSIVYSTDPNGSVQSSVVTDALGTARTYSFSTVVGVTKSTAVSQPCATCGATANAQSYDTNGNISSRTDFNGNVTNYAYDLARNLETSRIEAYGTARARTITTDWHPDWRLESRRAEPKLLTTFVYNGRPDPVGGTASCAGGALVNGLPIPVVCKKIEQSTTDETGTQGFSATLAGMPRISTFTYNTLGQVLTADGPRTDVADVTTYTYYTSVSTTTGSVHSVGDLATVTNAVGHVTSTTNYDLNGRPLTVVDANGITSTMTYWPRGWLKTRTVNGVQTTSYDYDNVGQLTKVTLPDGTYLAYTYDTAHRLTDVTDNAGNSIHYTLDAMSNRTKEDTKDPANAIKKTRTRVYNGLNRLYQDIGGTNPTTQITQYGYDNNGNLKTVTDPLSHVTTNNYDELNRLISIVDANTPTAGTTQNTYNGRDQLTQVQDPRLVTTGYTVDGLGNVSLTQSPDSGNTSAIYDAAGNVTQRTDARGIVTNYTYDALNRLTSISYPASSSENVEFLYDYTGFGDYSKGHLSYISSADGYVIVGAYDEYGNITTKADWLSTVSTQIDYTYDNANRLASITYPSGRVVEYTRNATGQIMQVQLRDNATASPQTLVDNVIYKPFGPLAGLSFGNGVDTTLTYDADYRVTRITATSTPNWDYSYGYDDNGNITSLTDQVGANDRLYNYDTLHRLILDNKTTAGSLGQTEYQYDSGGNRILFKQGTGTALSFTQTYASTSNRETQYGSQVMTPDAAGNLTGYGTKIFTYDSANRMSLASVGSTNTTYRYNGLGQRTTKLVTMGGVTTTTHYDYDRDGKYLGQTQLNADGTYAQGDEYLWMDDLPIAQVHTVYGTNNAIASQQLLYIHADNLNTPRAMTDATKKVVWKWESEAYGRAAPSIDPDGDGVQTKLDLRFPGQIADAETGFYYNNARYYDPITGRYTQSDPIGLKGGPNSFAYALNTPNRYVDPSGLQIQALIPLGQAIIDGAGLGATSNSGAVSDANAPIVVKKSDEGDCCAPLLQKIERHLDAMEITYNEMVVDKYDLYTRAYEVNPGGDLAGYGTWVGHVRRYEGLRVGLGRMIAEAEAMGCKVPSEAYDWLNTPAPMKRF